MTAAGLIELNFDENIPQSVVSLAEKDASPIELLRWMLFTAEWRALVAAREHVARCPDGCRVVGS